eukprot:1203079-Alexandrium_andersonii.AAC.1
MLQPSVPGWNEAGSVQARTETAHQPKPQDKLRSPTPGLASVASEGVLSGLGMRDGRRTSGNYRTLRHLFVSVHNDFKFEAGTRTPAREVL